MCEKPGEIASTQDLLLDPIFDHFNLNMWSVQLRYGTYYILTVTI
jgi:hypothetical protein